MAITFVGFYNVGASVAATEADIMALRQTGSLPEALPDFWAKVRDFPSKLPPTCKLIGSWGVNGRQAPSVMVVEAESYDDLQFINNYYQGWLLIDWHPTATGGGARE